jgi:hypothetical protein
MHVTHITHITQIMHTPSIFTHTPCVMVKIYIFTPFTREHPGWFPEPTRVLARNLHFYACFAVFSGGV